MWKLACANAWEGWSSTADPARRNELLLNDGSGTFSRAPLERIAPHRQRSTSLAVGDVDADGDLDLVYGNVPSFYVFPHSPQNRLCLNLQRQLHAPSAPEVGQPYSLDTYLRYGPASQFDLVLPYLSTRRLSVPVPGLGTLGIDPMLGLPPTIIPQTAGVASTHWVIPNVTSAIGAPLYAQALVVSQPFAATLTNVNVDVVQ